MNQIFSLSNVSFDGSESGLLSLPFEGLDREQRLNDVDIETALNITSRLSSPVSLGSLAAAQELKVRADANFQLGVAIAVLVKPSAPQRLVAFEDSHEGEAFFESVFDQLARSRQVGCNGKRVAFLAKADEEGGVIEYRGFFSTAVFFNDHRLTLGFPRADALDAYITGVYNYLKTQFPALSFEFRFEAFTSGSWSISPAAVTATPGRIGSLS